MNTSFQRLGEMARELFSPAESSSIISINHVAKIIRGQIPNINQDAVHNSTSGLYIQKTSPNIYLTDYK